MARIQHLIVEEYGAFLGKHSERLIVTKDKEKLIQAPLLFLESVLLVGEGIGISTNAIRACAERGIPIYMVDGRGQPYAALYSAGLTGTVLTRREQIAAYNDERGVTLAKAFARGKISNQAAFLRYIAKYRKETDPRLYQELRWAADEVRDHLEELRRLRGATVDEIRLEVLSIEGRAAQRYWAALKLVVPEQYGWPGRERRGARDAVNSALNYCYGILYGQVERALVLAGLDPYGGYVHVDRPGKPSLVFDFIEEFRTPVVDRTVIGLANKRVPFEQDEKGLLTLETRRMLAERILGRLEKAEKYERKRQALRTIIQQQARHLATFVRRDRKQYEPFIVQW